jgi:SagB-type dehydrogenase family enzyme
VRRSRALVAVLDGGGLEVRASLTGARPRVRGAVCEAVSGLDGWAPRALALRRLRAAGVAQPALELARLLAAGVLVEEGTRAAAREAAYRRAWRWGPVTAAFHASGRDLPWISLDETAHVLAARGAGAPVVRPRRRRRGANLPEPRLRAGALPLLRRRASERDFGPGPLAAAELSDVLFAGLGVRALVRDPLQGTLPLGLAPSGGARAPLDALVYVRRVGGLAPGAYRYDRLAGALAPTRAGARTPPSLLLGGQEWTDGAAAVVFLAATFSRTAWKYRHPSDYRIVLVEAGHVAQNMLLAACALGLAATPTGAFADGLAEAALGIEESPDRALVHAVVLGRAPQRGSAAWKARSSAASG